MLGDIRAVAEDSINNGSVSNGNDPVDRLNAAAYAAFSNPRRKIRLTASTENVNGKRGPGSAKVYWRYLSTSHRPSVWVSRAKTVDEDGVLVPNAVPTWAVWISEDPVNDGDTQSPLGSSGINIGLPSDAILSTLLATRPAALATWHAYLTSRGWVTTTLSTYSATIAMVSDRYKPAARLWAMRAIAKADDIGEAAAYLTLLQVGSGDTWELAN